MRFIKPIDINALDHAINSCDTIITIEDGVVTGGLHSVVSEYAVTKHPGNSVNIIGLGVPDSFIEQGSVAELVKECGYDTDGIYKTIIDVAHKA
jgi:1-deoxy-D-xylulose-5-phosphate synthase